MYKTLKSMRDPIIHPSGCAGVTQWTTLCSRPNLKGVFIRSHQSRLETGPLEKRKGFSMVRLASDVAISCVLDFDVLPFQIIIHFIF